MGAQVSPCMGRRRWVKIKNRKSASLHSRYGRNALSAQRVAPERAALGEERIQRGSVSEELDA
jgi:hypothetical protein